MKNSKLNIVIRIPAGIHKQMLMDLRRSHAFAHERVGFLFTKATQVSSTMVIVTCYEYQPIDDQHYIRDKSVGAKVNSTAIRNAMQIILDESCGCFHVHLHDHTGRTSPSGTDQRSLPPVVQGFSNANNEQAHGILILSSDSFYGSVKYKNEQSFISPQLVSVIGYPMKLIYGNNPKKSSTKMFDRQSFLGSNSQFLFENIRVCIVGYGGGGSHIGQQLAHIGVKNITVFDDDVIEDTNLNRLIGGWFSDIKKATLKVSIAKRVIEKIFPKANVQCIKDRWQNKPEGLQQCDIVIGCVDSYSERQQLEAECRRYLIPYIDIGMDIHSGEENTPYMSGQIILSMPGMSCMRCVGFLTDKKLAQEAAKYGKIGGRPQVVWPNGVLASSAVGILVDLVTGWTRQTDKKVYLSYDGNQGSLSNHVRLEYAEDNCAHFLLEDSGPPKMRKL